MKLSSSKFAILTKTVLLLLSCQFQLFAQSSNQSSKPLLLYGDFTHMQTCKSTQTIDQDVQQLVQILLNDADTILDITSPSVMDKGFTPPSGDKHDYMSQGPYWWPDPTKADGLPYIRRDGEVNPERAKFTDRANLSKLISSVTTLSRAYFFSEDEKYAQKAIDFLQTWFLDSATSMNPHLEFGQAIPGRTSGRGIGIIETSDIGKIADAVQLLRASSRWSDEMNAGMIFWMKAYLEWLMTSEKGQDESLHPNNHGTWYNVQAAMLAIFTGQETIAKNIVETSKQTRLDAHIEANGSQPKEIARTRSFSYSTMNLLGLFQLALIGEKLGIDLWHYKNIHGVSLQKALDFLIPAASGQTSWPHPQIKPISPIRMIPHLVHASRVYSPSYGKIAKTIIDKHQPNSIVQLIYPIQI
ncbi:MAG: alginate lyase family protein [Saprospiraceae bacterium]|nr:alginate lyase family protein [Saprospiraceae bacterium]